VIVAAVGELAIGLAYVAGLLACAVICWLKGKPWLAVLGLISSGIFVLLGAIRLAKPGSHWALKYGPDKLSRAEHRWLAVEPDSTPLPNPQDSTPIEGETMDRITRRARRRDERKQLRIPRS
jgi:hypothetical protein